MLRDRMRALVTRVAGEFYSIPEDDINDIEEAVGRFRETILDGQFNKVLDLLELLLLGARNSNVYSPIGKGLNREIAEMFNAYGAAYRLDGNLNFIPLSSEAQGKAVKDAVESLDQGGMEPAVHHLREAAAHINSQQYADAVTDSIHAVESVARTVDPTASTLRQALTALQKKNLLRNRQLKSALEKLYDYTNDEQGVRHALISRSEADVGLDEAVFMFGACASFAAYLTAKSAEMSLDGDGPETGGSGLAR